MALRSIGGVVLVLAFLAASGLPAQAFPPVGQMGEGWYEGVWLVSIDEKCYRHTDGKFVNLPDEELYMTLRFCGDGNNGGEDLKQFGFSLYCAEFYSDSGLKNQVGSAEFDFDFPSPFGETYLIDGRGRKDVFVRGKFWGQCSFEFQGGVKTHVKQAREGMSQKEIVALQQNTQILGWNIAWCDQFSGGNGGPAGKGGGPVVGHKCKSQWSAEWLRALPEGITPQ